MLHSVMAKRHSSTAAIAALYIAKLETVAATAQVLKVINAPKFREYEVDECFDVYAHQCAKASDLYKSSFENCQLTANNTFTNLTINEAAERKKLEQRSFIICDNVARCNVLNSNLEYFSCIVDVGNINLNTLLEIRFNANIAYLKLSNDFNIVQKKFLVCSVEAQKQFVYDMRKAYNELNQCRIQISIN